MCTMCMAVALEDDGCAFETSSAVVTYATVTETSDASASIGTSYTIGVGDVFSGNVGFAGDHDWVRVQLVAGQTYQIDLRGWDSGAGTLDDPLLSLRDASGNVIATNDDGGLGIESRLTYTATTSGYYYLDAAAFMDFGTGTYQLSIAETLPPEPAPVATLDELADYLVNGFWQDNGESARRFDTSVSNVITVNITALTSGAQQLARWAFEAWSASANLIFQEVTGSAMISFDDTDTDAAYSTSTTSGDYILDSFVNVGMGWVVNYGATADSYSLQTYIHEIGHALGLGHQGYYNGSATYGVDETFSNDSWQVSIMSYFDQLANSTTNASLAYDLTPMLSDLIAIQSMYGASTSTDGNTIYGANTNVGGYMGAVMTAIANRSASWIYRGDAVALTVNDSGGIDTIDVSFSAENQLLNINQESFSNIDGLVGNIAVARGTVIENGTTGAGNDTLIGNDVANILVGNAGADSLDGGAGDDILSGGLGADTLNGGEGAHDRADYSSATAGVRADLLAPAFNEGHAAGDVYVGVEDLWGSNYNDRLLGNAAENVISGGNGDDIIQGRGGNDSLMGGDGNDVLVGGAGADTLIGGNGLHDRAQYTDAGSGVRADLLNQTYNTGFAANDSYSGIEDLYGSFYNDRLLGNSTANLLYGDAGDDILSGRGGNDMLSGGGGNDVLVGGAGADILNGGAGGRDRAQYTDAMIAVRADLADASSNTGIAAGDSYSSIEDLYGSFFGDQLFGDAEANIIWGDAGNDTIEGRAGNDTLNGGGGSDTLTGGAGADVFVFNVAATLANADTITDFSVVDDTIRLENGIFTALSTGALAASAFSNGASATTAAHRIIYDVTSGELYYDADGSDAGAAVLVAHLQGGLALSANDFFVV